MSELQLYSSSAFLLVYHGSRDPRPKMICEQLANYFQRKLDKIIFESKDNYLYLRQNTNQYFSKKDLVSPSQVVCSQPESSSLVETVALELAELPLHQNILRFAQKASAMGKKKLVIIPLFLSSGVHVKQDIPSEIALAKNQISQSVKIILSPPLGSYSGLETLTLDQFSQFSPSERILLAHGSRLTTANHKTEYLARYCKAQVAYWSIEPNLERVIQRQIKLKPQKIAIMPYFLFPGRITDAIAEKVFQLQSQLPQTDLIIGQPLGATKKLAQLIFNNIIA